jgi:hypothetical protein
MTRFGRHVIALLDHLEVSEAVIGGTSLGANVTLEAACSPRSEFARWSSRNPSSRTR